MAEESVYINPLTDFGFKFLFGDESNKDLLISFLNSIFEPEYHITDVNLRDKEKLGRSKDARAMIYDIHCITESGKKLIVEMQNRYQANFADRTVYYVSGDISSQGEKGEGWNYELTPVYGIFITNFTQPLFEGEQMLEKVSLMNERTHKRYSDKIRMFFLKVPYMNKRAEECADPFEGWMYMLKNMENMKSMPEIFMKDPVFRKLEHRARIGALDESERKAYDHSLKVYRDNLAIINYERAEGRAEGIAEGMAKGMEKGLAKGRSEGLAKGRSEGLLEAAKKMEEEGIGKDMIYKITGILLD